MARRYGKEGAARRGREKVAVSMWWQRGGGKGGGGRETVAEMGGKKVDVRRWWQAGFGRKGLVAGSEPQSSSADALQNSLKQCSAENTNLTNTNTSLEGSQALC